MAVRLMQPGAQGRLLPRETALEMAAPVATLAASASLRLESPVSSTPGDDGLLADSTRPPAPLPLLSSSVRQLLIEGGNLDVEAGDLEAAFPRLSTAMPSVLQQALAAAGVRVPEPVDGQPVGASFAGSPFGSVTALSASPSAVTAMRPEFVVAEPFGGERWAQAVGERVMMLLGRDQQMAELKLTPPNLGQLEVRVSVQQDQASVAFVSQHAAVRDALEQAIPRLREMLAQQDLQLVNVDVSQRETGQQAGSADAGRGRSGSGGGDMAGDGAALSESGLPSGRVLQGMVDLFA